jgi:hypothetical protein
MEEVRNRFFFQLTHHSQTYGYTEVANRRLGNMLRSLVTEDKSHWDQILPQT